MEGGKPPIILANWDENEGQTIIKSIFPPELAGTAHTPEVLISRCHISTESIFAKGTYDKITFTLPLVAIKKLAVVNFDVLAPADGNARAVPFFLVIFVPLETPPATLDALLETIEPRIEEYKDGQVPDLERLQEDVAHGLETSITGRGTVSAKEELKQELAQLVEGKIAKMANKGTPLKVMNCPSCGSSIFPDELACTHCRLIVRTYCVQCNATIDRRLRFCSKCGLLNPRYDPAIELAVKLGDDEARLEDKTDDKEKPLKKAMSPAVAAMLGKKVDGGNPLPPDGSDPDLDASMQALEKEIAMEIAVMKKSIERTESMKQNSDPSKARLLDALSRDHIPPKADDEYSISRFQDAVLQNPASDETVRLIKRLAGAPPAAEPKRPPEAVLLSWDCDAFLHSSGRILVGRGARLDDADGIPGTMFVTETALIFISFKEKLDKASNVFSYFDASLQHLGGCNTFSPHIKNNAIVFDIHGMCAKKFPLERSMAVNFSWIPGEKDNPWVNQAIALRSVLKHQKEHPDRPPAPAGVFFQFSGKSPFDNAIKNVLASLQLNFPQVLERVMHRYPMLF